MKYTLTSALITSVLFSASATAAGNLINLGGKGDQFAFFDLNQYDRLKMLGGADEARNVSLKFEETFGNQKILDSQLPLLLSTIVGGQGWNNEHGLPGVSLGFLTPESFSFVVHAEASDDTVWVFGSNDDINTADVVSDVAGSNTDLKNSKSQFALFDTDTMSSIWIGGGASNARQLVSEQFADITGGSRIDCEKRGNPELQNLFEAVVRDKGRNKYHGIEGVKLIGLTPDSFTIEYGASGPTTERIMFIGACAKAAIDYSVSLNPNNYSNFKNIESQVAVLDTDSSNNKVWLGDAGQVSAEVKSITGHTIEADEVQSLFEAVMSPGGLEHVRILGVTESSFTLEFNPVRYCSDCKDIVIFKGQEVAEAIYNVRYGL